MLTVGEIVIEPVLDGTAVLRPEMWIGSDWSAHQHLIDDDGRVMVPVGGFLVRHRDRLALLDTGVGDVHDEMFDGGRLLENLASLGVAPGEVDTIIVSHLHRDHSGWLVRDGSPVFERATVYVGAADWSHFVDGGAAGRRAQALATIADRVELLDGDGVAVFPGITTRATPGHTPGHTSSIVASGDERVIVLGDALHCPAQLTEVEWEFVFDVDPALARATRTALVAEAEVPGTALLPCHFPGMHAARLLTAHGTRRWVLG